MSSDVVKAAPPGDPPIKIVDRRWWVQGESETAGGEAGARKPTYVEQLEQQLAEKDEQLRTTIASYREAAAEFDAARVRARRDVAKEVERGKRVILAELLDVVDNLDRAIEAARRNPAIALLQQGVEMVCSQFLARLEGFGVTRLRALNERFDPSCHEAVTTVPTSDPAQHGLVLGVIREGYQIGGEVLRPAVVAVGAGSAPGPDTGPGDPSRPW